MFFAGEPIAIVALAAAAILLLDRVRPEKVYHLIDWPLLVMFAGLFIVVHAFEVHVVRSWNLEAGRPCGTRPWCWSAGCRSFLSNLVSNVPAVLLFKPLMEVMARKETGLAGAGDVEHPGRQPDDAGLRGQPDRRRAPATAPGVEPGFGEFLKVGIPLTVLTRLAGVAWMAVIIHY